MSDLKKALIVLEAAGIDRVEVQFSGGGDSGQIDYIGYFRGKEDVTSSYFPTYKTIYKDGKYESVDIPASKLLDTIRAVRSSHMYDFEKRQYVEVFTEEDMAPDAVIEAHVYDALDDCGVDYYNNDGGQGKYTFTLEDGKWTYEFYVEVNYVEANMEYMSEGTVGHEEDEE